MSIPSAATVTPSGNQAVIYNGFRFPQGTLTESFTSTPVYDSSGRTVIYNTVAVTVSCIVQRRNGAEPLANTSLLSQPGGAFTYLGRGLGDFRIQVGGARDCMWGPKPRPFSIKPHGDYSAKLTWSVEMAIPVCVGTARYTGPMEFNYKTSVSINKHGVTTRTYSGFIRIAQSRNGPRDRRVINSADEWREKINPPLLNGFRRIPGQFSLSEDKCRLDFEITDEEFGGLNVPPPEVTEVEAEHSIGTANPGRLYEWMGTFSATYSIPKGHGNGVGAAINAFARSLDDRIKGIVDVIGVRAAAGGAAAGILAGVLGSSGAAGPPKSSAWDYLGWMSGPVSSYLIGVGGRALGGSAASAVAANKLTPCIVPVSFRASEPTIYDTMRVRLEMQYRIAGATLADILSLGGLWRPIPGLTKRVGAGKPPQDVSFDVWATSLQGVIGSRGDAGVLLYSPGEEDIVDLCAGIPADQSQKKPQKITADLKGSKEWIGDTVLRGKGSQAPLKPARSWISYNSAVKVEEDSGVVVGRTLPTGTLKTVDATLTRWDAATGLPNDYRDPNTRITPPVGVLSSASTGGSLQSAGGTFTQRRTTPLTTLILTGYALRVGYSIPKPTLLQAGNVNLVECNRPDMGDGFEVAVVGQGGLDGSLPIFGAKWQLRYVIPGGNTEQGYGVPTPPNAVVT